MAAIIRHLFANEELTQRAKSVFGDIVEEAYLCFNKEDDGENEAFIKYSEGMTAFLSTPQSLQGCLDSDRPIAIKFKNGRIVEMSARDELMVERVDQDSFLVV